MSIRALRTLLTVHRHGSFRAAAEVEGLTPAAVSQQMRNLETSWDLPLFDRSQRTPQLTETGLSLVGEASAVVAAYDNLADLVRSRDTLSGDLIVGAVPTTLTGLVPLALSQLKVLHPGIRVRIVPGLTHQLLLQLERGQIHTAVISRPDVLSATLLFTEIAQEELVLLVAQNAETLPLEDQLRTQPFIRFNRDAVVGRQVEAWLQRNGIVVRDAMELDALEAISSMVAAGLGISIVPQRCVNEHRSLPLRTLSLGQGGPKRVLGLVSQMDSPRTRIINATHDALVSAVSIGKFAAEE